jgi:hypothetical protein
VKIQNLGAIKMTIKNDYIIQDFQDSTDYFETTLQGVADFICNHWEVEDFEKEDADENYSAEMEKEHHDAEVEEALKNEDTGYFESRLEGIGYNLYLSAEDRAISMREMEVCGHKFDQECHCWDLDTDEE